MGATPRSPDLKESKTKHPSILNNKHHHSTTTHNTEIPVSRPFATAPGNQHKTPTTTTTTPLPATAAAAANSTKSTYQEPGPGFDQIVTNVPGVGLVYNRAPVSGSNPASGQQAHLQHQGPGLARPQVLPPGFVQASTSNPVLPQFVSTVSHSSSPAMAYTSFMPNQGQHFQPPVPDTTYGAIPHTYTPRFDNPAVGGQYVTIEGQVYRVVGNSTPGGAPVQYVPFQQAAGGANPILMQQGTQQPVYVQAQAGLPGLVAPAPVANQPGAFPAMVAPQVIGGASMPGAWPVSAAPDVMGIGKTGTEIQIEQYHTALNTKALEGQDIAPGDPDPSRMYYTRELDGEWTLRNRYTIDHMDDCRWYVMPGGIFYAVRLAD